MALYVVAITEPSGSRCLCCLRAVPVTSPADSRGSGGVQISGRSCTACPLASLTLMSFLLTSYPYHWHASCS
jgi:hypothetical protein